MKAWRAAGLAMAGVLVLAGCRTSEGRAALPDSPSVVDVAMHDYRFDHQSTIPAGRVLFRIRNVGGVRHSLTLLPLTEDMPPIQEQLRGNERRFIIPQAVIKALLPGSRTTLAVELVPGGRYALVCFVKDDQGVSHALQGMASELRTPRNARDAMGSDKRPS